jgi:hypothetical protein
MKRVLILAVLILAGIVSGCSSQADTASKNVGKECEKFNCQREITAINGITDKVIFQAEGRCSVENGGPLGFMAICKVGENEDGKGIFRKHFVTASDNVTVVVTQLEPIAVSEYRTKWIIKPSVPDLDLLTN